MGKSKEGFSPLGSFRAPMWCSLRRTGVATGGPEMRHLWQNWPERSAARSPRAAFEQRFLHRPHAIQRRLRERRGMKICGRRQISHGLLRKLLLFFFFTTPHSSFFTTPHSSFFTAPHSLFSTTPHSLWFTTPQVTMTTPRPVCNGWTCLYSTRQTSAANESSVVRNAFLWYSRVACGLTA